MATETETYKLLKPDEDDFYDIGQFNQTMDLIDESLKAVVEKTAALQSRMSILQEELTQYTDTKISDLIGGAPETLDTLKEVADAIQENDDVVTALTEAIGTKQGKLGIGTFTKNIDILGEGGLPQTSSICWCQSTVVSGTLPYESKNSYWFLLKTEVALDNSTIRSQKAVVWGQENNRVFERIFTNGEWYAWKEYLRTDGDLKDTTVSFTSGDDLNPTGWTAIGKIFSGARLKDILNGFSTGIKNLRFLYKLIGTTDISKIGDGTLTGIVSALNTDIQSFKGLKYINFGDFNYSVITLDNLVKNILSDKIPLSADNTYIGRFVLGAEYRIIIQPYRSKNFASALLFSYALDIGGFTFYTKRDGIVTKYTMESVSTVI